MKLPRRTRSSGRMGSVAAGGTVWCQLRGESNVERCIDCPFLEGAEQRGGILIIHCRPPRTHVTVGELLAGTSA